MPQRTPNHVGLMQAANLDRDELVRKNGGRHLLARPLQRAPSQRHLRVRPGLELQLPLLRGASDGLPLALVGAAVRARAALMAAFLAVAHEGGDADVLELVHL